MQVSASLRPFKMLFLSSQVQSFRTLIALFVCFALLCFAVVQQQLLLDHIIHKNPLAPAHAPAAENGHQTSTFLRKSPHQKALIKHRHHEHARSAESLGSQSTKVAVSRVSGAISPGLARHSSDDRSQPEQNQTAGPLLITKRAGPEGIDFHHYRCKGERYLANMRTSTPNPPKWSFGDLAKNGWRIRPIRISNIGTGLQQALSELRLSPAVGKTYDVKAGLENNFYNNHNVKTVRAKLYHLV